ncbi:43469_t:CDS:2, partial [Gigaspora margarita]
ESGNRVLTEHLHDDEKPPHDFSTGYRLDLGLEGIGLDGAGLHGVGLDGAGLGSVGLLEFSHPRKQL